MTIHVLRGDFSTVAVEAEPTATEGLVVNPDPYEPEKWNVTVASCGTRVVWARSRETARLLAGALAGIPVQWTKVPPVRNLDDGQRVVEVIRRRLDHSPKLFRWLCVLSETGA